LNPLDALNILEKKLDVLVYQLETLKRENTELHNLVQIERERTSKLEQEILLFKQEKQSDDFSKQEVKGRIEELIKKLTGKIPGKTSEFENKQTNEKQYSASIAAGLSSLTSGINMLDDDSSGFYYDEK
jgi:predicted RNase H-like nuclease (RuvC/YqgF family)